MSVAAMGRPKNHRPYRAKRSSPSVTRKRMVATPAERARLADSATRVVAVVAAESTIATSGPTTSRMAPPAAESACTPAPAHPVRGFTREQRSEIATRGGERNVALGPAFFRQRHEQRGGDGSDFRIAAQAWMDLPLISAAAHRAFRGNHGDAAAARGSHGRRRARLDHSDDGQLRICRQQAPATPRRKPYCRRPPPPSRRVVPVRQRPAARSARPWLQSWCRRADARCRPDTGSAPAAIAASVPSAPSARLCPNRIPRWAADRCSRCLGPHLREQQHVADRSLSP